MGKINSSKKPSKTLRSYFDRSSIEAIVLVLIVIILMIIGLKFQ